MDIVTAFLNGDLDEIIHMEQSEGFVRASAFTNPSDCSVSGTRKWAHSFAKDLDSLEMLPITVSVCGSREGKSRCSHFTSTICCLHERTNLLWIQSRECYQ
jgi:hypothetical protein